MDYTDPRSANSATAATVSTIPAVDLTTPLL
jgi:hypothetical protein